MGLVSKNPTVNWDLGTAAAVGHLFTQTGCRRAGFAWLAGPGEPLSGQRSGPDHPCSRCGVDGRAGLEPRDLRIMSLEIEGPSRQIHPVGEEVGY